jgi:hypothetical protein
MLPSSGQGNQPTLLARSLVSILPTQHVIKFSTLWRGTIPLSEKANLVMLRLPEATWPV